MKSVAPPNTKPSRRAYLLLSSREDRFDVLICDLAFLAGEHMVGTVPNHLQHLILAQLVSAGVNQSTYKHNTHILNIPLVLGASHPSNI